MGTSTFCQILVVAGFLVGTGCQDVVRGEQWDLGTEDAGRAAENDADVETAATDVTDDDGTREDVGSETVADAAPDSSRDASTHDAAPDQGADAGPGVRTVTGWYSSAFEHSGFVPDENGTSTVTLDEDNCSPYVMAESPAENWWTWGEPVNRARNMINGGTLSRMQVTGEVSAKGMYGHLGGYDREFEVSEGDVLECETAAAVGHCVYPKPPDLCVVPSVSVVDPDADGDPHLVRTYPGPEGPTLYELRITYNENVADGRTDVVISWSTPMNSAGHLELGELESVSMLVEQHGVVYREIEYEQLEGWVADGMGGLDARLVSITGVSTDDGTPLRVWGFFGVDETIAQP